MHIAIKMKKIYEIIISSEEQMAKLAKSLTEVIKLNDIISLTGNLGVGKTFLCRQLIKLMTDDIDVPSPTYNIVQTYPLPGNEYNEIWHCDFYRLESFGEVEEIGVFEDLKKK